MTTIKKKLYYKDAIKRAKTIDNSICFYDFIVNNDSNVVVVDHCDGSYLEFHSACYRKIDDEWIAVFTEHHGFHVYHIEDINKIYDMPKEQLETSLKEYRNKKNGKIYVVNGIVTNSTNQQDGQSMYLYHSEENYHKKYVREINEFESKFEKV